MSYIVIGGCITILGVIDDIFVLSPYRKLFGQLIIIIPSSIYSYNIDPISLICIIILYILLINAANLIDGIDGLLGAISIISFL